MAKRGIKRIRAMSELLLWLFPAVLCAFCGAFSLFFAITDMYDFGVGFQVFFGVLGSLFLLAGWYLASKVRLAILDLRAGPVTVRARVRGKECEATGLEGGFAVYHLRFKRIGQLRAYKHDYEKFTRDDAVIVTYWPRMKLIESCELEDG